MNHLSVGSKVFLTAIALAFALPCPSVLAQDDTGRFMQGFYSLTTSALEIPYQTVNSTLTKPFPFGVVDGVLRGTVYSVTKIFGGLFDMGAAVAPYAKYAVFFV